MSEEKRKVVTAYDEIMKVERKLHNAIRDSKLTDSRAGLRKLKGYLNGMKWELGELLMNHGEYERALDLFDSLPWRIHGEKICDAMVTALIGLGNYNEARRILEKGLKRYPESYLLWVAMGGLHEYLGDKIEALRCLNTALQFGPKDNPQGLYARASILIEMGCYGDAVQIFNDLIEKNPNDPKYFADRGYCTSEMGYPREALQDYQQAISIWQHSESDYDGIDIFLGLCSTYSDLGMEKEAMEIALKGLKRFPDEDPGLYFNVADCFFERGWYKEAEEVLKEGIQKFPDDEKLKSAFKDLEEDMDDPDGKKPTFLRLILLLTFLYKRIKKR
jgi:tetratricopeptide (TPR) repeat protein